MARRSAVENSQPEVPQSASPRRATVKRQPKEILERIIAAATAAFTKDGFKGTRMRSVAADAGITIQLLVYHVKSKEHLWQMVMENIFKKYEQYEPQNAASQDTGNAGERLRAVIANIVHYTATAPELHRIMTQEGGQLSPRLIWLTETFARPAYKHFVALVEEAQREGFVRTDAHPGRLRFAVQAMAAVPFSVSAEYEYLTGKSPFTRSEIEKTIELICQLIFTDRA